MNTFARKQLEKYGWSEGKGLGKDENGIAKPIKPYLKFDNHGIGHDSSKVWTSKWWCEVFNDASQCINVVNDKSGVSVSSKKRAVKPLLPSSAAIKKHFVKGELMKPEEKSILFADSSNYSTFTKKDFQANRNEDIYKKCESHKRKCFNYSLMKGKLKRIEKQEALYNEKVEKPASLRNTERTCLKSVKHRKHSKKKSASEK